MYKKFDWKELDAKVKELCASDTMKIAAMAQQLNASGQTIQRSMRRQGIKRDLKAVARG